MSSEADRLRTYLGEKVDAGGTDADTMFTDAEIDELLLNWKSGTDAGGLYGCAAEGWERKAAQLSSLVDQQQGGAARSMGQLYRNAIAQADRFRRLSQGRQRTRIGTIRRKGTTLT